MSEFIVSEEGREKLAIYIKSLREKRGIGLNQLALKAGIQKTILSRIESGKILKINPFFLKGLAEALGINYKGLYIIVGYLEEEESCSKNENSLEITVIELPIYGAASAGGGAINIGNPIRKENFILLQDEGMPRGAFAVEVSGDSMSPTLLDGDIAVIDPNCHYSDINNQICLVTYEGQEYIKRISDNNKFINLMSDNPDRATYKDIIILKMEDTDFRCHGIVIESKRKHKKR